jgi:hypothetical protein
MVSEYIAYFKELATRNKRIRSFFMMDADSAVAAMQEGAMAYPCMILETLSGRYADSHHDNPLNLITGGFMVVDRCEVVNDFEREAQILDETFSIGAEVVAKINEDVYRRYPPALAALRDFDPNKVKWQQEGALLDNAFGTLFTFPITRLANLAVTPEAWDAESWRKQAH